MEYLDQSPSDPTALELFIKSDGPRSENFCLSMGLRHLAFKVDDVRRLAKVDQLGNESLTFMSTFKEDGIP